MANVNKDTQAAFMEAVSSIKEYAKVNGNTVTRDDINNFFKDMALDESKFQMISGYLMANNIKIEGEAGDDNEFLKMMENAAASEAGGEAEEEEDSGNISEEEKEDKKVADDIVSHLNYEEDEKYLKMYLNDLSGIQPMTDTTRSYLLMNIVEDKDKESLKLLTESYLEKIVGWIEPFRGRGALACDLIQEANLAMTAYIGQQEWLNNYEWKDKIKEGSSQDLLDVIKKIDKAVQEEIEGSLNMMIDEQQDVNMVSGKILNKVNLVNDWAVRLREELGRKPTVKEVAENMGVSENIVTEAIRLSSETIEDIDYEKSAPGKE
ncbi:MAG: sigma-70 domain-containing protein [Clostridia bacterium]|nr:sigma-70 domain-containing protein [Clostridia bacterium]